MHCDECEVEHESGFTEDLRTADSSEDEVDGAEMGFLGDSGAKEREVDQIKREREEARTLASRLHMDLDRLAKEVDEHKQRAYGAERAAKAAREEARASKIALLQSRNQTDAIRQDLLKAQQLVADRDIVSNDLHSSLLETKTGLARAQSEIEQLKRDRENEPVSDMDLLVHYKRLRDVFESLQATLTCPLCYEPLHKGEVISLVCGHTFCLPCVQQWAVKSAINRHNATKGMDIRPECPECRGDASRQGRLKVFALEESVRILQRLDSADMAALPEDAQGVDAGSAVDAEAAAILLPRRPMRYAGATESPVSSSL